MSRQRQPAIVAELGRPETPEETLARKAEASRKRRSRQTITNLWLSLIASLGVVLVLVLIVPRGDQQFAPDVDYRQVAQEAQGAVDAPLVVPELGSGWRSNSAELRTSAADKIVTWYIGFLTPAKDYLGFSQGVDANPTWLSTLLQKSRADSTTRIGGREWTVYDNRETGGHGNVEYALSTETADGIYAVYGTADPAEAEQLAAAVGKDLDANE
ncbi:DUF4245 domain-containing protein [Naasia aerilata]|uniref:DUF4245 domain-containing protein n=1 Tax=Naasia aerilata TaxID=1162966 RepID=A0ABN6XIF6_9MICO|nr:DUF4245 domain-containing protein [Naasia aerilata]BDZ44659.1 hypothetical protein GCM10025866_05680 [Naasia aerilata]